MLKKSYRITKKTWDMHVDYEVWTSQEKHNMDWWKPTKVRYPICKEEVVSLNDQNI